MADIINRAGNNAEDYKSTGFSNVNIEGVINKMFLHAEDFSFANEEALKDVANFKASKLDKSTVVLFEIENDPENNNREATIINKRGKDVKRKKGIPGLTLSLNLSTEQHAALLSYNESSIYKRISFGTTENEWLMEVQADGSIKGLPMASFIVQDAREEGTDANDPVSKAQILFQEHDRSIFKPDFDLLEQEGVYGVAISQLSAAADSLKFKVEHFGTPITNLTSDNFELRDEFKALTLATFIGYDEDEDCYEFTGTGFSNGWTISLDGVQEVGSVMYENKTPLTISGIS